MQIKVPNGCTIEKITATEYNVNQINSIKTNYPDFRQDSKAPTFALTYQGTFHTLMKDLGFSKQKAQGIEHNFRELYSVSIDWVQAKLDQASIDGFVETAFGLKVRTPMLSVSLRNNRATPFEAEAEGRTAGNALGQGYGMLNNRAANAFMEKVRASKYALDIMPVAMIHDAIYLIIRDDIDVVEWVNNELIHEMQWQELPELAHDTVKLGAELDLFYPSWADSITLPNNASQELIRAKTVGSRK